MQANYFERNSGLIHSTGCRESAEDLLTDNLDVILGVGVGLLVFQLFNIMLAGGECVVGNRESVVAVAVCRAGSGYPQREGSSEGCETDTVALAMTRERLSNYDRQFTSFPCF